MFLMVSFPEVVKFMYVFGQDICLSKKCLNSGQKRNYR